YAIINEDDSSSDLLKRSTAQHVLTYGCQNKADVMATNIKLDITKTTFTLETPKGSVEITSRLIGMFNVYNMLPASSAAIVKDVPVNTRTNALDNVKGVHGRFEPVLAGHPYAVIVDYAHTPDSLENVLQTIKEFAEQKVYVVIRCGVDRARAKRPLMAQIAVNYADQAIFTPDTQ